MFPSKICSGYFGTRRFDRILGENGSDPSMPDILEVAKNIGIKERKAKTIADEIKMIVSDYGIGSNNK